MLCRKSQLCGPASDADAPADILDLSRQRDIQGWAEPTSSSVLVLMSYVGPFLPVIPV